MYLRQTGCKNWEWMELAQYSAQWRAIVLPVLNCRILHPQS
jgi:hypothetical protein